MSKWVEPDHVFEATFGNENCPTSGDTVQCSRYVFAWPDWCCQTKMCHFLLIFFGAVLFSIYWPPKLTRTCKIECQILLAEDCFMENFKTELQSDSVSLKFTYSCQVLRKSVQQKWPNRFTVFLTKSEWNWTFDFANSGQLPIIHVITWSLSSAVVVTCVFYKWLPKNIFTSAMLNCSVINCASGSKNGYKVHKFIVYFR